MFFLLSSSKKRSLGKVKKRSIVSFLAKVSLKVKRGKFAQLKPQQQEEVSSGHVTSDDVRGSIDTSGTMSYKCAAESSDSLDEVFLLNSTMDADSDDSMSLEETKLNMDTRLTPLSFDDTQVTNHFKSSPGGEDFSLHKVLSPRVDPSKTSQDAHVLAPSMDDLLQITNFLSCDLEDFQHEVNQSPEVFDVASQNLTEEDENRRKFNHVLELVVSTPTRPEIRKKFDDVLEKVVSTPPRPSSKRCSCASISLPPAPWSSESDGVDLSETVQIVSSEGQEDSMNRDQMRRSDSSDSIPSLSGGADALDQVPTDNNIAAPTCADDAADSVIAWGCLAALLGSPAPRPARKQMKRIPVNFWQDDASLGEDLDALCLPQDDDELGNQMRALSLNAADDLTKAPNICNIPPCDDLIPDVDDFYNLDFPTTPTRVTSEKDIADSTLSWGILGAILGSPAPSSVSKKSATRKRVNLWDDGKEDDLLPEIEGQDYYEDECDVFSAPIDLTELVEADEQAILADQSIVLQKGDSRKESAESVLAWTALGMLLGSPAPKSVCKKSMKESEKAANNLWRYVEAIGDALDTVPFISPDLEDEEDDPIATEGRIFAEHWRDGQEQDSVPSLSRTPSLSGTSDEEDGDSL